MTEDYGHKVRELLPPKFNSIDAVVKEKLGESSAGKPSLPAFAWDMIGSRVTEGITGLLDCDTFVLLARAWAKARELRQYTDETKHPRDKERIAFLGKHKIVSNVYPVVEINIEGIVATRLKFTLELAAEFRTAALTIVGGQIVAIGAGDCAVSAQLKYENINLHEPLKSKNVRMSEPKSLNPPLAIG